MWDALMKEGRVAPVVTLLISAFTLCAGAGLMTGMRTGSAVIAQICGAFGIPIDTWLVPTQGWVAAHATSVEYVAGALFALGLTFTYGHSALSLRAPLIGALGSAIMVEVSPTVSTWSWIVTCYLLRVVIEGVLQRWVPSASVQTVLAAHVAAWISAPVIVGVHLLGYVRIKT